MISWILITYEKDKPNTHAVTFPLIGVPTNQFRFCCLNPRQRVASFSSFCSLNLQHLAWPKGNATFPTCK